jgi:hexosaminidase
MQLATLRACYNSMPMLKKIFGGLGILILVAAIAGGFLYWQFLQKNKPPISDEDREMLTLMPLPAKAKLRGADVSLGSEVAIVWKGKTDPRLTKAWARFSHTYSLKENPAADFVFELTCDSAAASVQRPVENESYTLNVSVNRVELNASTPYGILQGLETLRQLISQNDKGYFLPGITIQDNPRFPWRGVMIDVGRHFIDKETLLRNIDLMASVKLNVLHLHLTEYQAFRIESKIFPKLHELGSGGSYYTQADIREIVGHAAERGIRVVPEFDMPGHATSWFVGYPELATKPGPYSLETKYGVLTPIMDPTKDGVYEFLEKFIAEMATLFPDEYIHIGGDEVSTVDWENSATVSEFMKTNNINDYHALQLHFNKKMKAIFAKHGKKMIGWDEVLHPEIGKDVVVQCWRSHKSLFGSVEQGNKAILSAGYYLDHKLPAGKHYSVDPEVIAGAVTIEPDSVNWNMYDLTLKISDNPMKVGMVVYGRKEDNNLRGVFTLMENSTGFENARYEGNELLFTFQAEVGEIDVKATFSNDSAAGTMSLGFMSFHFEGVKIGGNDMVGTTPPKIQKIKPLTDQNKPRILGGEAAMWTEVVSDENVDSRLWPRSAAIAEKLWSPQVLTKNPEDMYRRLTTLSKRLESRGGRHISGPQAILTEIAGERNMDAVTTLAECLEEAKYYDRLASDSTLSTTTPLTKFVDGLQPESHAAVELANMSKRFVADPTQAALATELETAFQCYADNDSRFREVAKGNQRLENVLVQSENLKKVSTIALRSLNAIREKRPLSAEEKKNALNRLDELQNPRGGIVVAIIAAAKVIVEKS